MVMTKRKKPKLTRKRLLHIFSYDRDQGRLIWKNPTGNRVKIGAPAGNLCRFHGNDYIQLRVQTQNFLIHRLIWFIEKGSFPKHQIDHIDGNGLNNRIENLRDVTIAEQAKNLSRRETNTSGVTGVVWNKNTRAWIAQISTNGQPVYLGQFTDPAFEKAVKVRKEAEAKYGFHKNHDRIKLK